nr:MAG TPA: protein of unknown function (DUF4364) [Caudoviricetes sp.]
MDLLGHLATWADGKEIDGEIFYHLSAQKMVEELPIISKNKRTFLTIIQNLKEKGLIEHKIINNKGYYRLTDEGKSFTREVFSDNPECEKKCTPNE